MMKLALMLRHHLISHSWALLHAVFEFWGRTTRTTLESSRLSHTAGAWTDLFTAAPCTRHAASSLLHRSQQLEVSGDLVNGALCGRADCQDCAAACCHLGPTCGFKSHSVVVPHDMHVRL